MAATTPAAESAVVLSRLRKEFPGTPPVVAVDDIDLDIRDGEFFSMLGPSGSGKTTVLRMIAGFETPTSGRVELGGRDVTTTQPYDRDVNTVFQDYALFPHMSVLENVEYGLRVKKIGRQERRARAMESLEQIRLPDFGARRPGQLSGGQRQRVALARALVNRPRVLLLDEPLGALDLKLREQMQVELKAIQRDVGITFLFVTHDQEEALTLSDRIAVFNAGRIEQVGTPREIYGAPATPFVADFVGKINVLPAVAEGGGRFRVGTLSLDVACREVATGTAVKLYLRPEEIAVNANGAAPGNNLAARVAHIEFLGAFCMIGIALDAVDAPALVANVPRQTVDAAKLATGQAVTVSLPPSALRVLG